MPPLPQHHEVSPLPGTPAPLIVPPRGRSVAAREALHSSASVEWYTPGAYIAAVQTLLGRIDLDPASCAGANRVVRARRYHTITDNGLARPWYGRVFLNPPYGKRAGRSNQEIWSRYLLAEYHAGRVTAAVLLVNAATDTRWFQPLWAHPVCFVAGRIPFWRPAGSEERPTHASAFVYLGEEGERFREIFREFGPVVRRWR